MEFVFQNSAPKQIKLLKAGESMTLQMYPMILNKYS